MRSPTTGSGTSHWHRSPPSANLLPSLTQRFIVYWPSIEVEIFDLDSANVREMVESGHVELGIAGRPTSEAVVTFVPLFRNQFKLVVHRSSALVGKKSGITWQDLDSETLIVNGASQAIEAPEYRAAARRASLTVRNVTSLTAFVSVGLGVKLLPELSTRTLPKTVKVLDVADARTYREVGLLQRPPQCLVRSQRNFTGTSQECCPPC